MRTKIYAIKLYKSFSVLRLRSIFIVKYSSQGVTQNCELEQGLSELNNDASKDAMLEYGHFRCYT